MNTEERQVLERFLSRLTDIKGIDKNPEADRLIQDAVARQPDAAYLLIQRNLLLEKALENAKARIEELQLQRQPAPVNRGGGSFLGGDPWAQPAPAGRTWDATPPGYRQHAAPPLQQSGAPSFLGNMASTAAGVVAGSFLFQGIESLMHGGQHDPWGASAGEHLTENTTINNYYGSDQAPSSPDAQDGWSGQDDSFLNTGYDFSDDDTGSSDDNWI
ncbi:DUF2076 domain-containing protein [Methylococcus mesophilus]|uniref:DUF2076 domain-containing protein n=1 Tax=Methylococcus mesophilus TaxID=2993564 RepID=UPI00224A6AD9|nr:DUF2076 domain-containing protein [Methylococcus mesophilus]UZR29845.1 DUF2076 domain-containing protein [Methylococcus mesophilus]